MHARYSADGTVAVTLEKGDALGHAEGPLDLKIVPRPGLILWDALVESGLAIAPAARTALGWVLRDALKATGQSAAWQSALLGQSQDTRDWWAARYDDPIPVTATKLVRIAGACTPKVDLDKLFAAAGA